ncbi:uncharacterized protein Tco_0345864 [Tanacetum coccineum]
MFLTIGIIVLLFSASLVSSKEQSTQQIPLQNSGFETRPTNLSTNATSEFVLLDTSINVIPGWSYNGTVRFCPDIILTDVPTPLNFLVTDNDFVNSGFEVGPAFIENSTQGILLEADPNNDPFNRAMPPFLSVQSPLQEWSILGTVKYIDSKHYAVPRGRGAVELVCGNPSGIIYNINFLKHGQVTIDFIMGDANNSCVGDFVVYLQVGNTIWNFTMRSIGVGSREKHSVTFKAEFSNTEWVPVSFSSFNETRTSNNQVLCGPVIDSTVIRFSSGLRSGYLHRGFVIFSFLLAVTFPFLS